MRYCKRSIPKGYQIYTDFNVAGLLIKGYRESFEDFIQGEDQDVWFEREPENLHDKNAILVVGQYNRRLTSASGEEARRMAVPLGYVPKEIAEGLQVTGVFQHIQPRLNSVSEPGDLWLSMTIDVLGPKDKSLVARYFEHFESKHKTAPAPQGTLTFLKLCGEKCKKGLTNSEAEEKIHEIRQKLTEGDPKRLTEIDSLMRTIESLHDEFSDKCNVVIYNMKTVPELVVITAVVELFNGGKSSAEIDDDYEMVAEAILKIRPSLARSSQSDDAG